MTAAAQRLLDAALTLKARDRAELVEHLLGADADPASSPEIEATWSAEVERRRSAVAAGAPRGDTWPEVSKRLHKQVGRNA